MDDIIDTVYSPKDRMYWTVTELEEIARKASEQEQGPQGKYKRIEEPIQAKGVLLDIKG